MGTQLLDVLNQMLRRVPTQVITGRRDERCRATAATLIEADDAEPRWIELGPIAAGAETAARSAMQVHRRDAVGVPRFLPIDILVGINGQEPRGAHRRFLEHSGTLSRRSALSRTGKYRRSSNG
jgi:hypothetical protein